MNNKRVAIIGSGPSALYLLKKLLCKREQIGNSIEAITIFDRASEMGAGMPYSRKNADQYNICNISSEEIPELDISFAEWLKTIDSKSRHAIGVEEPVCEKATYPRIALGTYFIAQWTNICRQLRDAGIEVSEKKSQQVIDLKDDSQRNAVLLKTEQSQRQVFDRVVIATGHHWRDTDRPEAGYFASPWPIHKLLPKDGECFSHSIGLLGASLSAFDVVTSLAHRHGRFVAKQDDLCFLPHRDCGDFKIKMHSANGWLPHLQYEQREAFRDIYRHVGRDELLSLIDRKGYLRLAVYFDKVCRPALLRAFKRDRRDDMVERLSKHEFGLTEFVDHMTSEHEYRDPFAGMRKEMPQAENSIENDRPIHWKEVMDDLMYTLNFYAERMPAEDHLTLHSLVMPFLMNMIAALPLESARTLLALHDAGRIEIVEGHVTVLESENGSTAVSVECNNESTIHHYKMFVDCSGQKPVELSDYPFQSLLNSGAIRAAQVNFDQPSAEIELEGKVREKLIQTDTGPALQVGGIDIDPTHRVVGVDGKPNQRIFEIAFPHITGLRPYSYGLQACAETARIVVDSWCAQRDHTMKPHTQLSS